MSEHQVQYVQGLWESWKKTKKESTGNALIQHYMYLVHYHVERVASYIPDSFDKNDLKSLGMMGLFDALHKFEPERNLKFDTYATIRIHGSIMDGLRREDWLPRSLRDKAKKIEKVSQMLEQELGRTPKAEDVAGELGWPVEEVESTMTDTLYANILSTDTPVQSGDAEEMTNIVSTVEDYDSLTPDKHTLQEEIKAQLTSALEHLNKNEQLVISLFYMEELTLTEIGHVLDLTTSRISQIHKKAIFKLKDILTKLKVTSYVM